MELNNFDSVDEKALQEIVAKHKDYIVNLEPDDLIERLVQAHDSTNVILEGMNITSTMSEGHAIAVAGLLRLREAIVESIDWLDHNLAESVPSIDEESDEL